MSGNARAMLLDYIVNHAIIPGKVELSSGQQVDYYIDLRRVTLSSVAAPLVGSVMLDLTSGMDFRAVGGLTLGADSVATAMLHTAAQRGRLLDAFVVRNGAKTHGLQKSIEGPSVVGRRVLVVDDIATTGSSVLTAVKALRSGAAEVVGVAVVVDRGAGIREAVEEAGLTYCAAFSATELGVV